MWMWVRREDTEFDDDGGADGELGGSGGWGAHGGRGASVESRNSRERASFVEGFSSTAYVYASREPSDTHHQTVYVHVHVHASSRSLQAAMPPTRAPKKCQRQRQTSLPALAMAGGKRGKDGPLAEFKN